MTLELVTDVGKPVAAELRTAPEFRDTPDDFLFELRTNPRGGSASIASGVITYTPYRDFLGIDMFLVRGVTSGLSATVVVTVVPAKEESPVPQVGLLELINHLRSLALTSPYSLRATPATLQSLLDKARQGDVIVLEPGLYPETYTYPVGREVLVVQGEGARLTGLIVDPFRSA